jgi:N utilization substance protein B
MGRRRKARELALQVLYELDLRGDDAVEAALADFWQRQPPADTPGDAEIREFASRLVRGTKTHQAKIDEVINRVAERWDLDRMAVVDRNILRAGVFELLWAVDVPPVVVINEALEIARKFSTEESTRFINGVLDRVRRELSP